MASWKEPVPRRLCRCSTLVLFPDSMTTRTCWNCGTSVHLGAPTDTRPHSPHKTDVDLSRPAFLSEEHESAVGYAESSKRRCSCGRISWRRAALNVLLVSISVNVILFWQAVTAGRKLATASNFTDVDSDGVPDHDDFCNPSLKSWTSDEKTTDFDMDGCEDASEDDDKDNDGVFDDADGCPFTPQNLLFVSNRISDFDSDGCADGLEDDDNDADLVPNSADLCPRTRLGHASDSEGCSVVQRTVSKQAVDPRWWELLGSCQRDALVGRSDDPGDIWDQIWEWVAVFRSEWWEVLIGAFLTVAMSWVVDMYKTFRGRGDVESK